MSKKYFSSQLDFLIFNSYNTTCSSILQLFNYNFRYSLKRVIFYIEVNLIQTLYRDHF